MIGFVSKIITNISNYASLPILKINFELQMLEQSSTCLLKSLCLNVYEICGDEKGC